MQGYHFQGYRAALAGDLGDDAAEAAVDVVFLGGDDSPGFPGGGDDGSLVDGLESRDI